VSAVALLELRDVQVRYGGAIVALHGVSLAVEAGTVVALLGANGAGKSTALKAASQLLAVERGEVTAGEVRFDGRSIGGLAPHALVAQGVSHVLEGRHCCANLSVEDNLKLGALVRKPTRGELAAALEQAYERFPRLKERRLSPAGVTSGGEQQMLAIARALMARPRLVLLDEPSMGLSPLMVQEIFDGVRALNEHDGVSFLLAEQNAAIALKHAHHAFVLEGGRVVLQGAAAALAARDDIQHHYLGGNAGQRRPFIDPHRIRNFEAATA
jgi:branched-chain amino acid transport system ATP-binding protein